MLPILLTSLLIATPTGVVTPGSLAPAGADASATQSASPTIFSEVVRTRHFEVRCRSGSRAEASIDRVAGLVEAELARILDELDWRDFDQTLQIFLYDDVDELSRITGTSGNAGFSIPGQMHIPHDNDQTRQHEMVHVVAEKLPEKGDEPRNLFFAEGLANAILRYVHGVPVDAVAAFYQRRGQLPSLAEIHAIGDFYAWLAAHPGFNGYDVAGSYLRYLLDTYGARKTRRYYCGVAAKKAFGVNLAEIEKGWHKRLAEVDLRSGLLALLRERAGEEVTFTRYVPPDQTLDAQTLGPAREWTELTQPIADVTGPGTFERSGDDYLGRSPADNGTWTIGRLGDELGNAMVRMRATPAKTACWGVQIQLGESCQAMVIGMGAFIYTEQGGIAHDANLKLTDAPIDIVLRRVDGKATMWINGELALSANVAATPAPVGIGVVMGEARFGQVMVRPLK